MQISKNWFIRFEPNFQTEQNTILFNKLNGELYEVTEVYYPGLEDHPGYEVNKKQATGAGSMLSFRVDTVERTRKILESVKLISYAESLGGVESLITYPMLQTHGDVPVEIRERLGITEDFLRMSVGIENAEDLIKDLEQAFQ